MHGRNGELGAVCHVANAVHTCSNCAASCATKEEGATVAFTMNVTTHKYAGPYELRWSQFSPDGTIHPPARSSDADRTGICQLPPPREGKDDTKSGETTAPQVNAEPSRQNEDWRQSAAADAPNTVDRSPASNTATNTSETRPEFAFVRKIKVAPAPPGRRPTPVTEPQGDPVDDAMSGLINVELLQGVDLFVPQTTLLQPKGGIVPVTTRDSFASPSLVSAGGVIGAFAEGHMDAEYQGGQLSKPFSSAFVAGCIDSVWNCSTVVGEVNERMHGGHTLWLVQRRERRVWVLCSAAQQSRRATEFFLLREALMCPTKVCVGERTAWSRNWLWVMSRIPRVASGVDGSNVATPNHSRN
ncbi:hypothetical protein TCDM_11399 [Trypanosoma cruzi Dm28c]|uniref:Trans-sialidase n=1 Tax=Trypanosoma cruzi Dm28c TaxID=1416333 RepID=V5B0K9_TRYCR|nr:hypothetical protein TCDM_11399 [Trypanosoma cruzi Dm28c]